MRRSTGDETLATESSDMTISNYRDARGKCPKCQCRLTFAKEHTCPVKGADSSSWSPSEAREASRAQLRILLIARERDAVGIALCRELLDDDCVFNSRDGFYTRLNARLGIET